MAAVGACCVVTSPTNSKNRDKFCNSDCHCCILMKNEIQALESEVKCLSEIISTLKDESNLVSANKEDRKLTCTNSVNCKSITIQCNKCAQLESQLQIALNEASSLKLITDILSEECKSMKQSTQMVSNTNISWSTVKGNNLRALVAFIQPKSSSHGASNCIQYAVPVTNRYAALSNHQQINDATFSPDLEQQSRYSMGINISHSKKHHWKKSTIETRHKKPTFHHLINYNLQ